MAILAVKLGNHLEGGCGGLENVQQGELKTYDAYPWGVRMGCMRGGGDLRVRAGSWLDCSACVWCCGIEGAQLLDGMGTLRLVTLALCSAHRGL